MPEHLNLEINREIRRIGARLDKFQGFATAPSSIGRTIRLAVATTALPPHSGRLVGLNKMCAAMGEVIAKPSSEAA